MSPKHLDPNDMTKPHIPMLNWKNDDADAYVHRFRNPNHKPALESGKRYVLRDRATSSYWTCWPLSERKNKMSEKIEGARRYCAEYLNRTVYDWTLYNEAVEV